MTIAERKAAEILNSYYGARGETAPSRRAEALLKRIYFRDDDGAWRSDDLRETAREILTASVVDVDELTEIYLGIDLSVEKLNSFDSRAKAPVFGLAIPESRRIVICERAEGYMPLYRATVAHELGHVLLHGGESHVSEAFYSPGSRRRPPNEREADRFMAALLLPEPIMKLATCWAVDDNHLHPRETIGLANSARGRWQWKTRIFRQLIDTLCVSRQFIAIHMWQRGVFTQETLEYHMSYALPNRWRTSTNPWPLKTTMERFARQYL